MRFKLGSGRHVVTAWAIGRTGRAGRKASVHVIVPTRAPDAVEVGGNPVGIAAVGNAIWVSGGSNGAVARVDAKQRQVEATVAIGGQLGGIAANAQAVWVSVFDGGTVARIDPSTNAVVGRVAVGGQPTGIAFGPDGSVWVGNLNGYASRIDPASDVVTAQVMLPSGASALLPSAGLLWVGLQDGSLVSIDPAANALSGPAIRVSLDVDALTEAPGGLWVSTFGGNAALVDPSSRTVMRRVKLPSRGSGVAFANGVVWVSLYDSRLVVELDPTTGAFVGAIHTGAQPRESVAAAGQLWVTDQASGQVTPIPL
jgi:streptogramin lyase